MRPLWPHALALVFLLTTLCGACAHPVRVHPLAPDDPRPRALIAAWNGWARQRLGLRARAALAVDGPDAHFRVRQVLVVERPSRLRVEVLGFLDQTVAVLVIEGSRYEFFDAENRAYESGEVHDGLLWQYARIDLTPGEAIDLLLGAPILDPTLHPVRAAASGAGAIWADLVDERGVVRQRVGFDREGRLVEFEVRDTAGALEWRARFEDYAEVDGDDVAHTIALEGSAGRSRAEIELRDVDLAPDVPNGLFRLRAAKRRPRARIPRAAPLRLTSRR